MNRKVKIYLINIAGLIVGIFIAHLIWNMEDTYRAIAIYMGSLPTMLFVIKFATRRPTRKIHFREYRK